MTGLSPPKLFCRKFCAKTNFFFTGYRPQFFFRTADITGNVTLPDGVEMAMPGDNLEVDVELIYPTAMQEGMTFTIREGGRTVGAGRITKVA